MHTIAACASTRASNPRVYRLHTAPHTRRTQFGGRTIKCESVHANSFDDLDIALFSAGGGFSREWAPKAAAAGCIVVDNSSEVCAVYIAL